MHASKCRMSKTHQACICSRREQAIATTRTEQPLSLVDLISTSARCTPPPTTRRRKFRVASRSIQIPRKHPASLPFHHKLTTRLNSITSNLSKMHTKINIAVLLATVMTILAENVAIETWQFEQITARGYPWAVVTSAP